MQCSDEEWKEYEEKVESEMDISELIGGHRSNRKVEQEEKKIEEEKKKGKIMMFTKLEMISPFYCLW